MSVSIEQAAANLAAALKSGNAMHSESALDSYEAALADYDEAPEPELAPLKAALDGSVEEVEDLGSDAGDDSAAEGAGDGVTISSGDEGV